jgi:hypothetical protein
VRCRLRHSGAFEDHELAEMRAAIGAGGIHFYDWSG